MTLKDHAIQNSWIHIECNLYKTPFGYIHAVSLPEFLSRRWDLNQKDEN